MTKPRLAKVRALLYVLHHIKEAAPILTQPLSYFGKNHNNYYSSTISITS